MRRQIIEFEETTKETEQDADTEVLELKHRYERKLKDEREIVMRLKGENGIMRKKFNTLQGEIDAHKGEIAKMYNEEKKLHSVIKSMERDIAGLKKEVMLFFGKIDFTWHRFKKEMKQFKTKRSGFMT